MHFESINWLATLVCVLVGQVFLTLWFVALFAKPWARAYGVATPKEHTKEVPGYTYAIGTVCVFLLSVGLQFIQTLADVQGAADALTVGLCVALTLAIPTALPGYAFLKRWSAFFLAMGSQTTLILVLSLLLSCFPR